MRAMRTYDVRTLAYGSGDDYVYRVDMYVDGRQTRVSYMRHKGDARAVGEDYVRNPIWDFHENNLDNRTMQEQMYILPQSDLSRYIVFE